MTNIVSWCMLYCICGMYGSSFGVYIYEADGTHNTELIKRRLLMF